jgi:hypothetical protein
MPRNPVDYVCCICAVFVLARRSQEGMGSKPNKCDQWQIVAKGSETRQQIADAKKTN